MQSVQNLSSPTNYLSGRRQPVRSKCWLAFWSASGKDSIKTMTIEEYHAALKAQGTKDRADLVMICPMCGAPQTGNDLIRAGAGKTFDDVEKYLGFSCVGRWTGAGSPRKHPDGKPCNWTLGGLFRTHTLEVVTPDGEKHPRFEVATPEQAQAHLANAKAQILSE